MSSSKAAITKACKEYRKIQLKGCQVHSYLIDSYDCPDWEVDSREVERWLSGHLNKSPEVHHIFGRAGKKREISYFSNLILIRSDCHFWGHLQFPARLELACLRAKLQQHLVALRDKTYVAADESQKHWHPESMAQVCGAVTLAGRISILMDKVSNTVFEYYGQEMLNFLDEK